jgi:uncharacterized protein involved in oxidation of intracellular sulfur
MTCVRSLIMQIGILINSSDDETVWNALRFGIFALEKGDTVTAFFLGKGVPASQKSAAPYNIPQQVQHFIGAAGKVYISRTGLHMHHLNASPQIIVAEMDTLYDLIEASEKIVTF